MSRTFTGPNGITSLPDIWMSAGDCEVDGNRQLLAALFMYLRVFSHSEFRGRQKVRIASAVSTGMWSILRGSSNLFSGKVDLWCPTQWNPCQIRFLPTIF